MKTISSKKQPQSLHDLVNAADIAGLKQFLANFASSEKRVAALNSANEKGQTALYLAARDDRSAILRILLENGANINSPSKDGYCPIHIAASEGHEAILKALLSYACCEVNACNKNGWTALMQASNFHHEHIVKLLLAVPQLAINAVSQTGCSALYFAASSGDIPIVKLLLASGADPRLQSKSGFSPLHIAAEHGHEEIIQELLGHDQRLVDLRDQQGRAAKDVAKTAEIKKLLYRKLVKTMSEDALQFNPQLSQYIPAVSPSASETIGVEATQSLVPFASSSSGEPLLRANEALLALSAADPTAIQHLLRSNDSQLRQQACTQYIQSHPFLQIYYLTLVKYLSSCIIALQALHSEFLQDTRSSQPEDVMAMLDNLASYSGFAGVGLVTYVGMYLCALHGDAERKYTIDQVMGVFPTVTSHHLIDLLAQDLTLHNEKTIHALAREAKNASNIQQHIVLRWIQKAEGLMAWIQDGFSSATGGYLAGGNGGASKANELIESYALVHAGKVLDGIFRYRSQQFHGVQILHRLNIFPLDESKLWILKCLALDEDLASFEPAAEDSPDSSGKVGSPPGSPATIAISNSPSKRRPLPPIPPMQTGDAVEVVNEKESRDLTEMLQKVDQLQEQLQKQTQLNSNPERNIYSEIDEVQRQLSQLTKKLQIMQQRSQDDLDQDVDVDVDVGSGLNQTQLRRNTMSKASSAASSNKSSSQAQSEGGQQATSMALLEQVVVELTQQVRLLQEDVSQLAQASSRESLPIHYHQTPPVKPKRAASAAHPRIDDGDNVPNSRHRGAEDTDSNPNQAACCSVM